MPYPKFEFRTIYFCLISIFGVVFILSLIGNIQVKNPMAISVSSLLVLLFCFIAWIWDGYIFNKHAIGGTIHGAYISDYNKDRLESFAILVTAVFFVMILGLFFGSI